MSGAQVIVTINLQCNSLTFKCLLQAENSMTGRASIGEVLIQVEIHQEMSLYIGQTSECTKIENLQGSRKLLQAHKKCAMKVEEKPCA